MAKKKKKTAVKKQQRPKRKTAGKKVAAKKRAAQKTSSKKKTAVKKGKKKSAPKKQTAPKKAPKKATPKAAPKAAFKKDKKKAAPPKKSAAKKTKELYKKYKKQTIALIIIIGLIAVWTVVGLVTVLSLQGRALPGTRVAGINAGLLTVNEIQEKLIEKGHPFLETSISVKLDDKEEKFSPLELGISLLPRQTLEEVKFISIEKTNLADILMGITKPREIPFYVSVDIQKATNSIEKRFNFDDRKARNAILAFEENQLVTIPEREGEVIDLHSLHRDIQRNANTLSREQIEVKTKLRKPDVTSKDLEEKMDEIKEKLQSTITLFHDSRSWNIKLIDHIDWVSFRYKDNLVLANDLKIPVNLEGSLFEGLPLNVFGEKNLWIDIDNEHFYSYIDENISPVLEREPDEVNIYTGEDGKIVIEGRGEDGQRIIKKYAAEALSLAVNHKLAKVPITVKVQKVEVQVSDDLKNYGIQTLLGTGKSAFAGSPPNRVHNIRVGADRYNGILIEPGEIFSFNDNLGPVTAAAGYLPELVIKPEGTIPEYGGGLCQVSTTIYRAALFSGLPIVERAPHSYAVSYYAQLYGQGLDATVYVGARDIRFLNDTPGHILIQAYVDGVRQYFKFYGTDDGRHVEMEGPYTWGWTSPGPPVIVETPSLPPGASRQVERAHTGFRTKWYRYLTKDGETVKEEIFSHYRAIPARILVGPEV